MCPLRDAGKNRECMSITTKSPAGLRPARKADTPTQNVALRTVFLITAVVGIAEALRWAYINLIYPEYSYFSYALNPVAPFEYGIALCLVIACALALPNRLQRPSHTILWILYLVGALPTILVPHYAVRLSDSEALLLSLQASASMLAISLVSIRMLPAPKALIRVRSDWSFWGVLLVWTLAIYALLAIRLGLPTSLPSLDDVYGVRDDYRISLGGSPILGYLIPAQASVINPMFIAKGIYQRKPAWIIVGIIGQLAIFSYSGLKSVLFSTLALLVFYWILRSRRPKGIIVAYGVLAGALLSMVMDTLQSSTIWTSLSIRRFMIVPGMLSGAYVSVFSQADKAQWGYSFLSGLVHYPYSEPPPYLVGRLYFGRPEMNANANYFADGYANWGFWGVLVEAAFIILLLWLVDAASIGLPNKFASLVFVVPAIAFANSSAFTTALTHGVLAGVFLCALVPRTGWDRPPSGPAQETG